MPILSLGDDTSLLNELVAVARRKDEPSLAIHIVSVLAEEHVTSIPSAVGLVMPFGIAPSGSRPSLVPLWPTSTHMSTLSATFVPLSAQDLVHEFASLTTPLAPTCGRCGPPSTPSLCSVARGTNSWKMLTRALRCSTRGASAGVPGGRAPFTSLRIGG